MEYKIIIIIILVMLSAFFSGVETAFTSLGRIRVRHMIEQKKKGAKVIDKIKKMPHNFLTTILIGNNLVNITASVIATTLVTAYLEANKIPHANVIGISTGIMAFVLLVFGEITPKIIAINNAERIAQLTAYPVYMLIIILYPLTFIFDSIAKALNMTIGSKEAPPVTEELLKTMAIMGEEYGTILPSEKELINKVFRLNDISVVEIMTPMKNIVSINANSKLKDVLEKISASGFSRMPVYEDEKNNIKGVIYVKDLIKYMSQGKADLPVKEAMRKVPFINFKSKINVLLKKFQKRREHVAIIIDSDKRVLGMITIEDILEEIVGEIYDETEVIKIET